MFINFSDIPGHQNLFLDFLYEFDKVKNFYKHNFRNKEDYLKVFKNISESQNINSAELSSILESQYAQLKPSPKTQKNISLLKEKKTLAVVTGQQLGLLGGPLYTFYKIITAIKLSNYLSERYDDFQFVPIFWLEGDDHDFEEVSYLGLVNENNEYVKIKYEDEVPEDENKGSVGKLKFNNTINKFFEELGKNLRATEYTNPLLDQLKGYYSEGKTFKQAFSDLLFSLFDEYGLVIFDPQDTKIKNLLKPVFKKEITDFRKHTEKLVNTSATLEELYHAQVKIRPVNLFYSTSEGRYLIEPVENEFRLRRKRKKFTYDELINLIDSEPEKFSANVLLRPVCQDYILPTAFYVGGPGEISYFAQALQLYSFYNIEQPIIYPRSSITLIEKSISSLITKYGLNMPEIFASPDKVRDKVVESVAETAINDVFNSASTQIELTFDQLKEKLFELDKTISDASAKYRQKILNYVDELKGKALEAQKKKHETTLRQVDKVTTHLFPNTSLQEREFNFIFYANKYGNNFTKLLFEELVINKFEHQVINL
ncbi:MAG: bacillithiol biosynthesis cysteine-adding enzyme BshC [Ignavibacteriaceae bacterium]